MGLEQIASKICLCSCSLLFLSSLVKSQFGSSPCPKIFQYGQDMNGEIIGKIGIFSDNNQIVLLNVEISVANDATNNPGKIELASGQDQTIRDIRQGKPIQYIVYFPQWSGSPPRVTRIMVNGRTVCTGDPVSGQFNVVSTVALQHSLTIQSSLVPLNSGNTPNSGGTNGGNWMNQYNQMQNKDIDDVIYSRYTIPTARTTSRRNPTTTFSKNPFFSLPTYQMPGVDTLPTTEPIREKPIKQTFSQDKFSTSVEKNPSSSSQCGTRMQDGDPFPLVVNGYTVREGEFPWLVAMFTKSSNSNFGPSFTFRCCGSLVSNKHVLTAAHCAFDNQRKLISDDKYYILLGKLNIRSWCDDKHCAVRRVSKSLIHPDHVASSKDIKADLAILVLREAVDFNKYIIPICLWPEEDNDLDLIVNQKGTVAGWGKDEKGEEATPEPKKISIPIVSQELCSRSNIAFYPLISDTTFCAGFRNDTGPCSGDSGSGFIMHKNGVWSLRGIVSFSLYDVPEQSCDLHNYVIFTDVSKYISWIKIQMSTYN